MGGMMRKRTGEVVRYLNSIGEELIFDRYLEVGNVRKVINEIGDEGDIGRIAVGTFYDWLKRDGRWERWQEVLRIRGQISADEAQEEADRATPDNATAQRLKFDAKRWAATHQDPERFGQRQQVNVAVGTPDHWLRALKGLDAEKKQIESGEDDIEEADYEVEDE